MEIHSNSPKLYYGFNAHLTSVKQPLITLGTESWTFRFYSGRLWFHDKQCKTVSDKMGRNWIAYFHSVYICSELKLHPHSWYSMYECNSWPSWKVMKYLQLPLTSNHDECALTLILKGCYLLFDGKSRSYSQKSGWKPDLLSDSFCTYKGPFTLAKTKIQKTWVLLLYRLHCQKNP